MIAIRDQFEGVVLRRLLKHDDPPRITEVGDKSGHFQLDDSTFLLIKYSSSNQSPWRFTFRSEDVATLIEDRNRTNLFGGSYICLVCGLRTICSLGTDEWSMVLDLHKTKEQQTITVRRRPGTQFTVTGTADDLDHKVPATKFPSPILG